MTYYICMGQTERYGNHALGGTTKIYKDFRFRDPFCIDTGYAKGIIAEVGTDDWILSVPTIKTKNRIKDGTDPRGLVWDLKEGTLPDNHQFTRFPVTNVDNIRDSSWQFGTRTTPKQNPPTSQNEGYRISSSVKTMKERGVIG